MRHKSLIYKVLVSWSVRLRHVATGSYSPHPTDAQRAPARNAPTHMRRVLFLVPARERRDDRRLGGGRQEAESEAACSRGGRSAFRLEEENCFTDSEAERDILFGVGTTGTSAATSIGLSKRNQKTRRNTKQAI
jgi:hypothetical protein